MPHIFPHDSTRTNPLNPPFFRNVTEVKAINYLPPLTPVSGRQNCWTLEFGDDVMGSGQLWNSPTVAVVSEQT